MSETTPRYLSDYQPPSFLISTVDLTFSLDEQKTRVVNKMQVHRNDSLTTPLVLDGEQLKLISIAINDKVLSDEDYQLNEQQLTICTKETNFTLTIETEINPTANTALEGLYKSGDAYCTQCEAEGFRRITYYLDRPDVMAVFTTTIIAEQQYPFLLANGNKVDSGKLNHEQHFVKWHDPFPKPCYLFALVAGDFDLLSDQYITRSNKKVTLEIYVDKGNVSKAEHAMTSLKKSMAWDEQTFDLEYDLDIYMIVAVDFFNMGAMENKGLNIFNSKFVLADEKTATDTDYFNVEAVIAHEYFHNWTGNRVTCRDWFQLSLKEGLTVFRDQQFSADMHSAAVTRIQNVRVLRSMQFAEDAGPMAHPIRPEKVLEMNNFYTVTVYEKGAEVIRMIHTLLGAEKFKQGLALYFQRFDGMAVTCDDFVNAMADASKVDLSQFKRWYQQAGTPELTVKEFYDAQQKSYKIQIQQDNKAQPPLHIPVGIELIDAEQNTHKSYTLQHQNKEDSWTFYNIEQKPIIAFLTNFTAPVKVDFEQSTDDLVTIMTKADDEFSRWDAGQKLLSLTIKSIYQEGGEATTLPKSLINAFQQILHADSDLAFKAEQLTLPTFNELMEDMENVDPILLLDAIGNVKRLLAVELETDFERLFIESSAIENQHLNDQNDAQAIAKRALKNQCLSYLALLPQQQNKVYQQFKQADNMTDYLAALQCAVKNNLPELEKMLTEFEQQWQHNSLVMDKWFSMQACVNNKDIFTRLARLSEHRLFTLKNPNRARSLIASFAMNNPRYFHCQSGRGYQFLADYVQQLDKLNPQIASRLITPLIQFSSLESKRQNLIVKLLKDLMNSEQLSKDLQEKLSATLDVNA